MSWFDTKSFTSLAKTALKEAQKKIDKVLDIQEDELDVTSSETDTLNVPTTSPGGASRSKVSHNANEPTSTGDTKPIETEPTYRSKVSKTPMDLFPIDNEDQAELTRNNIVGIESTYSSSGLNKMEVDTSIETFGKRQSVASTLESVDVLSPPQITPCSDGTNDLSESVELISATSEVVTSDSDTHLQERAMESIVIVSSPCDASSGIRNGSIESVCNIPETPMEGQIDRAQLIFEGNTCTRNIDELAYELQTIDSDSTQSFEEVQSQSTNPDGGVCVDYSERATKQVASGLKSETTSAHNSNDEMETATSSDIEIISNPNGDTSSTASTTTRTSPLKPEKKSDATAAIVHPYSNNVANTCSRKGHCREASEISILSLDSPSEDEVEKLLKRISELNSIVEARELRLLQSEQHNSELLDRNNELQALVNANNLQPSEEYTKRLSALEKKFQNCIRERDALRIEVKVLQARVPKNDLTDALTDSQNMVADLRHEGEKLSKEILQQSNIIKKLRSKEKASDIQLKTLRDQMTDICDEVERLKKTLSAKEDVERTQIEAVHKMSSENQRLDKENSQMRGKLEDTQQKLIALQRNFDAVKTELQQRSKQHSDLSRTAETAQAAEREKNHARAENQELQRQVYDLREKMRTLEHAAAKKEQQLREENRNLMDRLEAAEMRAETSTQEISQTTIPLMRHLESLQQTLNQRTNSWNKEEKKLLEKLEVSQSRLQALEHIEEKAKKKIDTLKTRCQELEEKLTESVMQNEKNKISIQLDLNQKDAEYNRQLSEMNQKLELSQAKIKSLEDSHLIIQQSLNEAESKLTTSVECLPMDPSSLVGSSHSVADETGRPHSPTVSNGKNSLEDGMGGSIDWQQDDLDCISNSGRPQAMPGLGFHYISHNTTNFEYLPSLLKQRDGELAQCQWELSRLQAERNVLQDEISQLSIEIENLKEKLQSYEIMENSFNDLQTRYDALLQMFGEKVERCDELELDLKECKEAYKTQIQELLSNMKT